MRTMDGHDGATSPVDSVLGRCPPGRGCGKEVDDRSCDRVILVPVAVLLRVLLLWQRFSTSHAIRGAP